jgi:Cu(I)/Ag(I) efflux system periplasmic protein CusF
MNKLLRSLAVVATAATVLVAVPAHAQAAADLTEAEVRKVDKENKKVTLKHGQIKNLDMPPMTMVFNVDDAALLDKVKPGDKIHFRAANEGGKFTVTEIHVAK